MISWELIKAGLKTRKYWLYLAGLLIWVGSYFGTYEWGKAAQRAETAALAVKEAKQEVKDIKHEVEVRTPVIEKAAKSTADLHEHIKHGTEKLNEATQARGVSPVTCDLTDDQLRGLNEIGS